jgi:hypothetical protein
MAKKRQHTSQTLVPHPRYGSQVIASSSAASLEEVRASFWGYASATIYPESAIPADASKQHYSVSPRGYYVDTLKRCRNCDRPFIFFALEQRCWFEVLRFWIDADCVLCPECLVADQQLRYRFRRYSERVARSDLSNRELASLLADALFLAKVGVIKDEQKLRRLRNVGRKRLPDSASVSALSAFLDKQQSLAQPALQADSPPFGGPAASARR